MWALSLDSWNSVLLGFLAVAALAASIVGIATYATIKLSKEEAETAKSDLETYKVSAKRDADVAIGKAQAEAEVKINAAREEARTQNKILENATATANKAADDAKLQTEKIKQVVAWRTLSPTNATQLTRVLSEHPGSVNLRYTNGDPESLFFAIQLSKALSEAKWQVAAGSENSNSIIFGLILPSADTTDMGVLKSALSAAMIPFSTEPPPNTGSSASFNVSTIPGAPTLMVGSRFPPILQ